MAHNCARCGSALYADSQVCFNCGYVVSTDSRAEDHDLEGIGGWLILVAIGLAVAPFMRTHSIVQDSKLLFGSQYQATIISNSGLHAVLFYELVTNSFFFAFLLLLNFLFYSKKRSFPTFMIFNNGLQLIAQLVDHLWGMHLGYASDLSPLWQSLVVAVVWIPYLMRSRRVGQTFVN